MNPANLQIEGLLLAITELLGMMKSKGLVTQQEIDDSLHRAEAKVMADDQRCASLSAAQIEGICFPVRFLRSALAGSENGSRTFAEVTTTVGKTKNDRLR